MSSGAVGIDLDGAEWFVRRTWDATARLHGDLTDVGGLGGTTGLGVEVAALVGALVDRVDRLRSGVADAVARVVGADSFAFGASGGAAVLAGSGWRLVDVLARGAAAWLRDHPTIGSDDLDQLEVVIALLRSRADDARFVAAFFDDLGADGVLAIPAQLARSFDRFTGPFVYEPIDDDGNLVVERFARMQDDLMTALGDALGGASRADVLADGFADELASAAIGDGMHHAWALSNVLRSGTYDAGFLVTIADRLDQFERHEGRPGMWRERIPADAWYVYQLGVERDDASFDPWVGLFEAMSRTPDAAIEFLSPAGSAVGEASPRIRYYVGERRWDHDEFRALALLLDAAGTAHRDPDDPRSTRSAAIASDAIDLLWARPGDPKIGAVGHGPLAHLLADYIVDVDNVASLQSPGRPEYPTHPWDLDLPVAARFDPDALQGVLAEVLTDPGAVTTLFGAAGQWNTHRLTVAANLDDDWSGSVVDAAASSAFLNGYLVGAAGYGTEAAGAAADARAEAIVGVLGDVIGLVPVPGGRLTGFVVDQTVDHVTDQIVGDVTGHESAATDANFDLRVASEHHLVATAGVAIGDAGRWDDPALRVGPDGRPRPWFDADGRFDAVAAIDDIGSFHEFAASGVGAAPELRATMAAMFDTGVVYGRAGR